MQVPKFDGIVRGHDLRDAENAGNPGHCRQHQGPSFPDRQRDSTCAGCDKAQQADVLLLIVPQEPANEPENDTIDGRSKKLERHAGRQDDSARDNQVPDGA